LVTGGKDDFLEGIDRERIEKQHRRGKLHVYERLRYFFDDGSFREIKIGDTFDEDGVIIGRGDINGRPVYVYAQDFTYRGGTVGIVNSRKIVKLIDLAYKDGCIVVGMIDSGGARIDEGVDSLEGYGAIFRKMVEASGVVPQISIIMGPSAGGAVYSPALTDFIAMVKGIGYMFVNGPRIVEKTIGKKVDLEELGGAEVHSSVSGVVHFVGEDEYRCMDLVKRLISYLPSNCHEHPPKTRYGGMKSPSRRLNDYANYIERDMVFDVRGVIKEILDEDSFLEVQRDFAKNVVLGFGRLDGYAIGIVANNRYYHEGRIDSDAADKATRFISFCNSFNIPIINIVDTPGFRLSIEEEHKGVIRHVAKLVYTFSMITVPNISLIIGNAYGGGYIVMGSRSLHKDGIFAWPSASIAVMKAEEAYEIIGRKGLFGECDIEKFSRLYKDKIESPKISVEKGYVDKIIEPADTRSILIDSLNEAIERMEARCRDLGNPPV
jgi:acetyl-CoA carboxylase carboxyltransferase component